VNIGDFFVTAAARIPGIPACENMPETLKAARLRDGEVYYEFPVAQDPRSRLID
jgi:hypothetical protein